MRSRRHYGKRCQEDVVDTVLEMQCHNPTAPAKYLYELVAQRYHVSVSTVRRWHVHYLNWGEYLHQTKAKARRYKRKCFSSRRTNIITEEIVQQLKEIVDDNPEFYIDEIAEELVKKTGVYLPLSTIYKTVRHKLGYTLQVCYESAKQRDELERKRYMIALKGLVKNAEQVIVIDETHKDKRASRRRRAWGFRNGGGVKLRKWFRTECRYTMIAGFNINGFVESTVGLYPRDEISEEGAAGTVDGEGFRKWLKERLCPVLGDYVKGERNSVVIMDNASTHMSWEVMEMIEETGALLLYTAPYSPDLSPIEYGFHIYKSNLKRHSKDFAPADWRHLHMKAMMSVTRDHAIKEFRKCFIPFSEQTLTSKEIKVLNSQ